MHPKKLPLAANGHATPMKEKTVVQSSFDLEYTFVIGHMVYISDSLPARMKSPARDFLQKVVEIIVPRNSVLILTVFPSKCVKVLH